MNDRVDQFKTEVAEMKIKDSSASHDLLLLRMGGSLMLIGLVLSFAAYLTSRNDTDTIAQGEHQTLGTFGLAVAVVGGVLFLRYSLAGFFKLWLARYLHAQQAKRD
jgi:hypothetical protein